METSDSTPRDPTGSTLATPRSGFTLLEIAVALLILSLGLAGVSLAFTGYRNSASARMAAQVFTQDLSLGRSYSVRTRDTVKVVFTETAPLRYEVISGTDTLVARAFGPGEDFVIDSLDLQATGDSIFFDTKGRIDFTGISGSVGVVRFVRSGEVYQVRFNVLGTSRVSQ